MEKHQAIEYLVNISQDKLELMREILEISRKQSSCTNEEKMDELFQLMNQKQEFIHKIDKLDIEFAEKFEQLKKYLNVTSLDEIDAKQYPALKDLKAMVAQILNAVEEIKKIDAMNQSNMENSLELVKKELMNVRNGIKFQKRYGKSKPLYGGVFIDKKK